MTPLVRTFGVWALAMAGAAGALKALDYVPALVAGVPHAARVFPSIQAAERALGARIWLPAYYPDELRWPPDRIEATTSAPIVVVARVAGRDGERERLVVAESIGRPASPPPALVEPAQAMETTEVELGRHRAFLVRVLVGSHEMHDLWWDQDGRRITLRYSGPVGRLLLMAGSLERMHS